MHMTLLISNIYRVWFLKRPLLISKICRVWFLKWHFWFPKFIAFDFSKDSFDFQNFTRFDFSNDTFDFQNLSHLLSQMTVLISKIYRVWFLEWHFWFPKFDAFWFLKWHFWFPKLVAFDFSNDTFNFQNFASLPAGGSPHLFDEFTRDLLFFCSLLVFGCHVRPGGAGHGLRDQFYPITSL